MRKIQFKNGGSLTLKNETGTAILYFFGDIVSGEMDAWSSEDRYPAEVVNLLAEIGEVDRLEVHINSGGGDVFAGVAIYNLLKNAKARQRICYVDGLAASIASVIAMSCDRIIMRKGSEIMIHNPFCLCVGGAEDLRKNADLLEMIKDQMIDIYLDHANEGIGSAEISRLMDAESWLTPPEAADLFSNVEIDASDAEMAASSNFEKYYKNHTVLPAPEPVPDPEPEPQDNTAEKLELAIKILSL
jgi:ATP-dependent protease ClpP protease subunit